MWTLKLFNGLKIQYLNHDYAFRTNAIWLINNSGFLQRRAARRSRIKKQTFQYFFLKPARSSRPGPSKTSKSSWLSWLSWLWRSCEILESSFRARTPTLSLKISNQYFFFKFWDLVLYQCIFMRSNFTAKINFYFFSAVGFDRMFQEKFQ